MKRYWLFMGQDYYANDGLSDFESSFDEFTPDSTHNELVKACLKYKKEDRSNPNWYQIFDSIDRKVLEVGTFGSDGKRYIRKDQTKGLNDLLEGGGL